LAATGDSDLQWDSGLSCWERQPRFESFGEITALLRHHKHDVQYSSKMGLEMLVESTLAGKNFGRTHQQWTTAKISSIICEFFFTLQFSGEVIVAPTIRLRSQKFCKVL
jgi:hypothetical protein